MLCCAYNAARLIVSRLLFAIDAKITILQNEMVGLRLRFHTQVDGVLVSSVHLW